MFSTLNRFPKVGQSESDIHGATVNYAQALEALRGHPRWWYYDLRGRHDLKIQGEAIELAKTWVKPELPDIDEHLREAAEVDSIAVKPCGGCP